MSFKSTLLTMSLGAGIGFLSGAISVTSGIKRGVITSIIHKHDTPESLDKLREIAILDTQDKGKVLYLLTNPSVVNEDIDLGVLLNALSEDRVNFVGSQIK